MQRSLRTLGECLRSLSIFAEIEPSAKYGKQPSLSFFILGDPGPFNWAELGFYTLCRHKSITVRQKNRGLCRNNSDKNVLTVGGWALDYPTGTRTHPSKENVFPLGGVSTATPRASGEAARTADFSDFHFLGA